MVKKKVTAKTEPKETEVKKHGKSTTIQDFIFLGSMLDN